MWYPTGSLRPALGGAFMALSPPFPFSPLLFHFDLFSISPLSSVVDDGSPGSSLLIAGLSAAPFEVKLTLERVRARFVGGAVLSIDCVCFLCLVFDAEEPASSSPEGSREEGCCRSAVSDLSRSLGICVILFRFAEPVEDGEDICQC